MAERRQAAMRPAGVAGYEYKKCHLQADSEAETARYRCPSPAPANTEVRRKSAAARSGSRVGLERHHPVPGLIPSAAPALAIPMLRGGPE